MKKIIEQNLLILTLLFTIVANAQINIYKPKQNYNLKKKTINVKDLTTNGLLDCNKNAVHKNYKDIVSWLSATSSTRSSRYLIQVTTVNPSIGTISGNNPPKTYRTTWASHLGNHLAKFNKKDCTYKTAIKYTLGSDSKFRNYVGKYIYTFHFKRNSVEIINVDTNAKTTLNNLIRNKGILYHINPYSGKITIFSFLKSKVTNLRIQ